MQKTINISDFNYELPDERIAKFPLANRDASKLLIYKDNNISERPFSDINNCLPADALTVFNNTKVIRARLVFFKASGARIEIFCLEPHFPADYERAFAVKGCCTWHCIIGNAKKWREGYLETGGLRACKSLMGNNLVEFSWDTDETLGQILERLGNTPIPPYLNRQSEEIDTVRYQTVYSKYEGSVAAPTAGLHFTDNILSVMDKEYVTLHVGAGTFLPVKTENAMEHPMHTEHFEVSLQTIEHLADHLSAGRPVVAVGTTSVRTLESLTVLGDRVLDSGNPDPEVTVSQWEPYSSTHTAVESLTALARYMTREGIDHLSSSTRIMIVPGYKFRVITALVTNFHQPQSTLLLLISALVGEAWHAIYDYALAHDFRFLSYGDSSLLYNSNK